MSINTVNVIQAAMLYALETVPQAKKTTRRVEVAELKMSRWAYGVTRIERVRNEDIRARMGVAKIGLRVQKSKTKMVWSCEKEGGELRRKEDVKRGST